MSLVNPHPLWTTASYNPYETSKAIVQARMLSGRYRTESLCRFWSSNPEGVCLLPLCRTSCSTEDLTHILITCQSLSESRMKLYRMFADFACRNPPIFEIVNNFLTSQNTTYQTQFLLDCSILPEVIRLRQAYGSDVIEGLFYLSRTWCFSLHRKRLRKLNRWNRV